MRREQRQSNKHFARIFPFLPEYAKISTSFHFQSNAKRSHTLHPHTSNRRTSSLQCVCNNCAVPHRQVRLKASSISNRFRKIQWAYIPRTIQYFVLAHRLAVHCVSMHNVECIEIHLYLSYMCHHFLVIQTATAIRAFFYFSHCIQ